MRTSSLLAHLSVLPMAVFAATTADSAPSFAVVASFDPLQGQLPESIALDDDDNVYLSMGTTIQRLTPEGTLGTFASIPAPPGSFALGVKVAADGSLYATTGAFFSAPRAAFVWHTPASGAVEPLAALDPTGIPEDLALDDDGNLFVTDAALGRIYKVTPQGQASIWLEDSQFLGNPANPFLLFHDFGVGGIAFDKHGDHIYVGNLDYGEILRVEVDDNGEPGAVETFASDARLLGADGIALDKKGTLYVAVNGQDQVVTVSADGNVSVLASGSPLDAPSSVAFGTHGEEKKTLYVCNFAINRAFGTQAGAPHPSLVATSVPFGGLALN